VAVLCPDTEFSRQIAKSIEDQGKKLGWETLAKIYYPRERFNGAQSVTELKQQGIDTVFHLGTGADTGALFKDAEAAGWSPAVYLLGTLVGRNITELVPAKMKNQVFLASPTIPADISAAGAAEYSALLEKNKARCNPCRSSGFRNRSRQDTGPWIGTLREGSEPRAAGDDA